MSYTTVAYSLLQQAAFLSFAVVILSALAKQLTQRPRLRPFAVGATFGIVGSLTLIQPITLNAGYIIDVRIAAMTVSGAIGGPVSLLVSTAVITLSRAYAGGAAMYVGVLTTVIGGLWLLFFLALLRRFGGHELTKRQLPVLAAASIVPYLLGPLLAPPEHALIFFRTMALPVAAANFLGVLFAGALILARNEFVSALTALTASEARLRSVADNLPGAIFERRMSPDGRQRYTYVSSGVERMFGLSPAALIADSIKMSHLLSSKDLVRFRRLQAEAVKEGMAPVVFESPYVDPHGRAGWMRISISPRRIAGSSDVIWNGLVVDITGQKRLETLQAEAEAEKRAALARLADEFEHGVGHALQILQASVAKMVASAVDLTASAQDTVIRAQDTVRDAETTNTHVHALAQNTQRLDETAADITRSSHLNVEGARRIGKSFAVAQASVIDVRKASSRVDAAIQSIQDLAARINLKALDAALAAARTGSDGFAAAASSVKEFAVEAERVTTTIVSQLSSIHAAADRAAEALGAVGTVVAEIECNVAGVAESSNGQRDTMRAIHEKTRKAAQSTGDVCSNMAAVVMQAEQAGTAASNLMNAVTVLDAQTNALVEHVDTFVSHVKAA
jgi:methyl-accepting chemotaxis protein